MRRRAVLVRVLAARSRPVTPLGRERAAERGHRHPASLKAWRRALQLAPETFGRVTEKFGGWRWFVASLRHPTGGVFLSKRLWFTDYEAIRSHILSHISGLV